MAVAAPVRTSEIGAVRRFNRFYTRAIGILGDAYPGPGLSLTEGRVIYEMAQAKVTTATALRGLLGLDAGYLSRMLKGFEARGLIERNTAPRDRRSSELRLTQAGRALYRTLDRRSEARIDALIAPLVPGDRARLAGAMHVIESLLEGSPDGPAIRLRPHRPGDMGWVIERHGAIYAQEQGWDERFEALVAEICAGFIERLDPSRERCWIAEHEGRRVGCVFVVKDADAPGGDVAKLRLLFVDPSARGSGLGRRLVEECIAFARQAGYRRIRLWTQQSLLAARRIYVDCGFRLIHSEPYRNFGCDLVSEFYEKSLEEAA